jgi:hypothetical protein
MVTQQQKSNANVAPFAAPTVRLRIIRREIKRVERPFIMERLIPFGKTVFNEEITNLRHEPLWKPMTLINRVAVCDTMLPA